MDIFNKLQGVFLVYFVQIGAPGRIFKSSLRSFPPVAPFVYNGSTELQGVGFYVEEVLVMTQTNRWSDSFIRGVLALLLIVVGVGAGTGVAPLAPPSQAAQAQGEVLYIPETGHTLRGAFLYFWRTNGGPLGNVYTFGYPITEEYRDPATGRIVQYFERARFEWIEEMQMVQIGDLGLEVTAGRTFPTVAPIRATTQRRYIPQTQHIIQYGFKEIWETHGAERIFGWPISEEIQEITGDGQERTVQYFTKARFEYWPEQPAGHRVIITTLGRNLAPPAMTTPVPPPGAQQQPAQPAQPFQPPATEPVNPPMNENATVNPNRGPVGTEITFHAVGFQPNEMVSVWLHKIPMGNEPPVADVPVEEEAQANDNGELERTITIETTDLSPGVWRIIAQGRDSKYQAKGHFVLGHTTAAPPPGIPQQPLSQTNPPMNENATVRPDRGRVGDEFVFHAVGFQPNELVSVWLHKIPMGNEPAVDDVSVEERVKANDRGELEKTITIKTKDLSPGVWRIIAQGWDSKYQAKGHFVLQAATVTTASTQHCDPAYPDFCIPPPPPDLDCDNIGHRNFRVLSPDPHGFDGDGDGIGCEGP